MPELVEVEVYRRAAEALVGRRLEKVEHLDPTTVRGTTVEEVTAVVEGADVVGVDRIGKLLLVELDDRPVLGLRFGMTGRLVVDGVALIEELEYGGKEDRPEWDRFVVSVAPEGQLRVNDPRKFGGVLLDPDTRRLGPDAAGVTAEEMDVALGRSITPLKVRLLDQGRVAGIGNLIADEVLWRAKLAPRRPAGGLTKQERTRLAREVRAGITRLARQGGSHTGSLQPFRRLGGPCPRCGEPLRRSRVGGRTTIWCPAEQR